MNRMFRRQIRRTERLLVAARQCQEELEELSLVFAGVRLFTHFVALVCERLTDDDNNVDSNTTDFTNELH